jgi:hypothetical protein
MSGHEKKLENINNYLKKIQMIISNNSSFSIFGFKFVKKKSIDDIFCCIEGTFPNEYRNAINRLDKKKLKGYSIYLELLSSFKKYKSMSSNHYMIKYDEILTQVSLLKKRMATDFKIVFENSD